MRELDYSDEAAAELARAVQAARLDFAFSSQPLMLIVSVTLAALTVLALHSADNLAAMLIWLACLAALNILRAHLGARYRAERARGARALNNWEHTLLAGCLAGGALWGVTALLFLPTQAENQFFLAFVIAGVSSGAVSGLSVAPRAAYAFVFPCVLPLALRFFLGGDELHRIMGIMTVCYIVLVTLVARRGHQQLTRMVRLGLQAQSHRRALDSSEGARRLSNERLRIAAEAGQIGVWEWDLERNALLWDEGAYRIYRVAPHAETSSYELWRTRVHPADLARAESDLRAAAHSGEYRSEYRIIWPDGEQRFIRSQATTVRGSTAGSARLIGIDQDITEFKRLERVKTEFVSVVSHELRTPVTAIRGALGLVTHDAAGSVSAAALSLLQMAERHAARLGVLIDDLLDIEQLEGGRLQMQLKPQPLLPLLQQALNANTPYAMAHKVIFSLHALAPDASAAVDARRLLQVMTNLLSNAVKFSPEAGTVQVQLLQRTPQQLRIEIRDQGAGVAMALRARVFDKFIQGDSTDARAEGGAGLGLAISKALIEQMGGIIGFESAPGSDTLFFFELPVALCEAQLAVL